MIEYFVDKRDLMDESIQFAMTGVLGNVRHHILLPNIPVPLNCSTYNDDGKCIVCIQCMDQYESQVEDVIKFMDYGKVVH